MSYLLLETFNHYVGRQHSASEAATYVASLHILPMPERISLEDWRAHVPMHLLEGWHLLPDNERIALYVMAQSATHPYECASGPDNPTMN